ncbi:hypothetical protein EUTSA_v10011562mg [Eutrema salsugineum]|uniref:FBD domain-containing protein n=1 Tax=Eutrema salsugineum TaxID=72664 RepID=V4KU52_EUTSA|nr:hypothetical protein EUTSA_v10011562mg [Eutrema salsugineum]
MDRISELSDELLVKILSFPPTKVAVSTSILSKQWKLLWMWLPKLEYNELDDIKGPVSSTIMYWDFIDKNLPLHRAPAIESLLLRFYRGEFLQPESIKRWVEIAVSRCVRELSIDYYWHSDHLHDLSFPSSLYTCNSLMTLKLDGEKILVDVPRTVYSLQLLLSCCPVLEDLLIERGDGDDNVRELVVTVPSLQRLSLSIDSEYSPGGYVIATPSLKYFTLQDDRDITFSCLIEDMPMLEEVDIDVVQDFEKLLESVTSVKRLSLRVVSNLEEEFLSRVGIVFNQLERFKLCICSEHWPKFLVRLLRKSPKLRVLNLYIDTSVERYDYHPVQWKNMWKNERRSSVPECLSTSLETLEFARYCGTQEERDFMSFFFEHVRCLKSISITD